MAIRQKQLDDLKKYHQHLMRLKDNLPYFEQCLPVINEVLKKKEILMEKYEDVSYVLGQSYMDQPLALLPKGKATVQRDGIYWKIKDCNEEIIENRRKRDYNIELLNEYRTTYKIKNQWSAEKMYKDAIEGHNREIDIINLTMNRYKVLYDKMDDFINEIDEYKAIYEPSLVDFLDRLKAYEQVCERESYLRMDYNQYLGFDYRDINERNLRNMVEDYRGILNEKIQQFDFVLSKGVDVIVDENEEYLLVHCSDDSYEIRDVDDNYIANTEFDDLEEALDELQNQNELSV